MNNHQSNPHLHSCAQRGGWRRGAFVPRRPASASPCGLGGVCAPSQLSLRLSRPLRAPRPLIALAGGPGSVPAGGLRFRPQHILIPSCGGVGRGVPPSRCWVDWRTTARRGRLALPQGRFSRAGRPLPAVVTRDARFDDRGPRLSLRALCPRFAQEYK